MAPGDMLHYTQEIFESEVLLMKKLTTIWTIIGIIVTLAAIGAAVYFWFRRKAAKAAEAEAEEPLAEAPAEAPAPEAQTA